MPRDDRMNRRTYVKLASTVALGATALTGCTGGSGSSGGGSSSGSGGGGSGGVRSFDGWMADVTNYDGIADETGQDHVTVKVGTTGNGGDFAFSPAAITVSTGTTVVWEWTGKGGMHNVLASDGSYESDTVADAGYTFEHSFEETGTSKYSCEPHEALNMRGVVVVE